MTVILHNDRQPVRVVIERRDPLIIRPRANTGGSSGGGAGGGSFVHSQGVADTVWTINHNLGFFPNVTAIDSSAEEIEGDLRWINPNQLTITYSYPVSGVAYLS